MECIANLGASLGYWQDFGVWADLHRKKETANESSLRILLSELEELI